MLQSNQIRFCVGLRNREGSSSRKQQPQSGTKDPQVGLSIQRKLMEAPTSMDSHRFASCPHDCLTLVENIDSRVPCLPKTERRDSAGKCRNRVIANHFSALTGAAGCRRIFGKVDAYTAGNDERDRTARYTPFDGRKWLAGSRQCK